MFTVGRYMGECLIFECQRCNADVKIDSNKVWNIVATAIDGQPRHTSDYSYVSITVERRLEIKEK
jgi:hypothetical protein